jgi:MoaA/NifB/PqqE/SkfB family radical SAM enzyme
MLSIPTRLLTRTHPAALFAFIRLMGWGGMRSVRRFHVERASGRSYPPFIFISVTNRCNLRCQGCWVSASDPPVDMDVRLLEQIIRDHRAAGHRIVGVLGGEPLLYEPLFDVLSRFRDMYFLLFTNGTLLDAGTARRLVRLQNVSPMVSIEGLGDTADVRRGGRFVHERTLEGLRCCTRAGLITGAASSICRSNMDELVSMDFIRNLAHEGVCYLWYYIYRAVGPHPNPGLCLTREDILRLRRFLVESRTSAPLLLVDAYWDENGQPICPAAEGISHHINPLGAVEVCPPIQFACDSLTAGEVGSLSSTIADSRFLQRFRSFVPSVSDGCILMDAPERLVDFMHETGARDTTGRQTGLKELAAMSPHPCHAIPGEAIPEASRLYRFAKRYWFFGLGAYG